MDSLDPPSDLLGNDAEGSGDVPAGRDDAATGAQEEPNPFCSERASDEFRLQRARPLQLAEFDDRQLDPGYESDTGLSGGFISAVAPSVQIASPVPARGSETSSEARHSVAASNAPSGTSRSRSPMREELPGVRELLVSLGNAVAGLAEEQRNTQRRLAVVEEIRSGSSSSMRTGREGVEAEVGQVGIGYEGMGTQFFQISDGDPGDSRSLRSGMLTLEDWVQAPLRLEDIPRESRLIGPIGVPESYGPVSVETIGPRVTSAQVGAALPGPGCSAIGQGIAGASSAQAGPGCSAIGQGIAGASSARQVQVARPSDKVSQVQARHRQVQVARPSDKVSQVQARHRQVHSDKVSQVQARTGRSRLLGPRTRYRRYKLGTGRSRLLGPRTRYRRCKLGTGRSRLLGPRTRYRRFLGTGRFRLLGPPNTGRFRLRGLWAQCWTIQFCLRDRLSPGQCLWAL